MSCLKHTDGSGPEEHFVTPFDTCPLITPPHAEDPCGPAPCPCPGECAGMLRFEQFNVGGTLAFMMCDVCKCTYVVGMEDP